MTFEEFTKHHLEKNPGKRFSFAELENLYREQFDQHLGLGHNKPPPVTDEEFEQLAARAEELKTAFIKMELPNSTFPEKFEAIAYELAEFAKMCSKFCATVEDKRKVAKEPSMEAGREIDGKYAAISDPIKTILESLKEPLRRYMDWKNLDQVRSEHGALISLRTTTQIKDFNRKTINLDLLRPFLDRNAIEKAIYAYLRSLEKTKGGKERKPKLTGVKFIERSSLTIR